MISSPKPHAPGKSTEHLRAKCTCALPIQTCNKSNSRKYSPKSATQCSCLIWWSKAVPSHAAVGVLGGSETALRSRCPLSYRSCAKRLQKTIAQHTPPPPPCISYALVQASRRRDPNNCVRNFNYLRDVVRPHKTWVCRHVCQLHGAMNTFVVSLCLLQPTWLKMWEYLCFIFPFLASAHHAISSF